MCPQAAMAEVASTASGTGDLKSQIETQPLLLKGHLIELDEAIREDRFSEYTSKRTQDTYPGGKVERELEEVEDTVSDFLRLLKEASQ